MQQRRPQPTPRRTGWQTFVSWNRDERFWRDVYSRTLSTLIVGVIIYVFAVVGGYTRLHAASVAALALSVAVTTAVALTARVMRDRELRRGAPGRARLDRVSFWLNCFQAASVLLFVAAGVALLVT